MHEWNHGKNRDNGDEAIITLIGKSLAVGIDLEEVDQKSYKKAKTFLVSCRNPHGDVLHEFIIIDKFQTRRQQPGKALPLLSWSGHARKNSENDYTLSNYNCFPPRAFNNVWMDSKVP